MDCMTDSIHETVVVIKAARMGFTEMCNNAIGYFIEQDPGPIMVMQPTVEMGQAWSRNQFSMMLRDTPCLKAKVSDIKSRSGDNTILYKQFPGGHITIVGANSPSSMASRTERFIIFDEVDRYPISAGTEGDPISLTKKRAVTFFNRKFIIGSTPGIEGMCRITDEYEKSDQRQRWLPCPQCGGLHLLEWKNIVGEKNEEGHLIPGGTAIHACPHCGAVETDADLHAMDEKGVWIPQHPEVKNCAGFQMPEFYSPWIKYSETVKNFIESKENPEMLKTWVNTALGEVWTESKAISSAEILLTRKENYTSELVPMGGVVITIGVDVQDDRLELETVAWGTNRESWSLEHLIFRGDPSKPDVWAALDAYLGKTFRHETGAFLRIMGTGIDTGGHHTRSVYEFCKKREAQRVFALKGSSGQGRPIVSGPSKSNLGKVKLYSVGVDTAKDVIASNLTQKEPGSGYCHFPYSATYDEAYFAQFLAERAVVKFSRGQRTRSWQLVKQGNRNEALDMRVYALATLTILGIDLNETIARFYEKMKGIRPQVKAGKMRMLNKGIS
jgi:phage terminase large subunit GpA-like protein